MLIFLRILDYLCVISISDLCGELIVSCSIHQILIEDLIIATIFWNKQIICSLLYLQNLSTFYTYKTNIGSFVEHLPK